MTWIWQIMNSSTTKSMRHSFLRLAFSGPGKGRLHSSSTRTLTKRGDLGSNRDCH